MNKSPSNNMTKDQVSFDELLNPVPPNPCETCGRYENSKCTYPDTRYDYCFAHNKWIPKTLNT